MPVTFRAFADWVFPTITPLNAEELRELKAQEDSDLEEIARLKIKADTSSIYQEAVRLSDAENSRQKGAESRATTYLAVLAALIPIVLTIQTSIWENKIGTIPSIVRIIILTAALAYTSTAARYAFMALQVTKYHRIGVADITSSSHSSDPAGKITKIILRSIRKSQEAVNIKVTYVNMTHMHLFRAFLFFMLLLLSDPMLRIFTGNDDTGRPSDVDIQRNPPEPKIWLMR